MRKYLLTLVSALASLAVLTGAAAQTAGTARYIVELDDPSLASYTGGIPGLAPTNPAARGEVKLDVDSPASKAYLAYLDRQHGLALAAARRALGREVEALFEYSHALNGFAAALSEAEAARLASLPGVASVQREQVRHIVTDAGPAWIGAPAVWGGTATGGKPGTKGEGIVVGVIDTGINHDHPSFADVGGDGFNHTNPRGRFFGLCDPVTGAPFCNDKLIGVHDFTGTSPLDDNGHGSHTASTAVGNAHSATIKAPTISLTRQISGVAPHANLITYKACLAIGSCVTTSLVAAINQAVTDGVDVINYSIGGGPTDPWNDSDARAFNNARAAGVFAAVSAGNDGPRPETVGSPANAPWVMAVGAATHNRKFRNALVSLSGGATTPPANIEGKSFTSGHGPARIVYAGDFGDNLCARPFAPGTFRGEIVVCDRGVNPRVEKGRNVKVGGAGGMVLANAQADGESTIADPHELPAVHIGYRDGVALKAWLDQGTGHSGTIVGTTIDVRDANGDVTAGFSSRGPNKSVPGVMKPDVTAPGVDILAAVHTSATVEPEYGVLSGTSMSGPHAAGAAALVRALHPDWTPAEVQSAFTTTGLTASVRKEDGVKPADPFDMGGGRVDLTKAGAAGLVLNETKAGYDAANPGRGGDPRTLNLGTLTNHDCEGVCTWTRTVRNALGQDTAWSARSEGPRGLVLSVSPSRFSLAPGATQTLTVTADARKLPVGAWAFGAVRLTPQGKAVPETRLPVALVPAAPQLAPIETTTTSGSATVTVEPTAVEIKQLQTRVFGLAEGRRVTRLVEQDPTSRALSPYEAVAGTFFETVEVSNGSRFLTAEIADTTAPDVDLYVGRDTDGDRAPDENEELCASASEISAESCKLQDPQGGTYWVLVQNWQSSIGIDEITLVTSVIPGTDNGNLTVTGPSSVPAGQPFTVTVSWNEPALEAGDTWWALVEFGSDRQHPNNAGALLVKLTRTG